jgi:hypothetical protein
VPQREIKVRRRPTKEAHGKPGEKESHEVLFMCSFHELRVAGVFGWVLGAADDSSNEARPEDRYSRKTASIAAWVQSEHRKTVFEYGAVFLCSGHRYMNWLQSIKESYSVEQCQEDRAWRMIDTDDPCEIKRYDQT